MMKPSCFWSGCMVALLLGCQKTAPPLPSSSVALSQHLLLGNPSGAVADSNQPTNYLLEKPQYALSYHRLKGTPNWVCWHLDPTWLGNTDRQDDFRPDTSLPPGWYAVKPDDYANSGFDRGHLCPSADRTRHREDNSATFLMSNMIPQAPDNNRITWENLESYGRKLVKEGHELYLIAGPWGEGGSGSHGGITYSLAGGRVTVPAYTWKVLLVLPNGEDDLNRITADTRVIAVKLPNNQQVDDRPWPDYRLSVDELEAQTGYDFLSSLPLAIQAALEARVDTQSIQ